MCSHYNEWTLRLISSHCNNRTKTFTLSELNANPQLALTCTSLCRWQERKNAHTHTDFRYCSTSNSTEVAGCSVSWWGCRRLTLLVVDVVESGEGVVRLHAAPRLWAPDDRYTASANRGTHIITCLSTVYCLPSPPLSPPPPTSTVRDQSAWRLVREKHSTPEQPEPYSRQMLLVAHPELSHGKCYETRPSSS